MIKLIKILRWCVTGFFTLFSLALLTSGNITSAIFMTGVTFLVSPLAKSYAYSKIKWSVPTWVKMAVVISLFSVSASFVSSPESKLDTSEEEIQVVLEVEQESTPAPTADLFMVAEVTDGDTIKVFINEKVQTVRLVNMNTPETVDPRRPVECMGKEASEKMIQLATGKKVSLETDETQNDRDRYDRLLRFVFLEDGTDLGLEMIKQGYAESTPYGTSPHKYLDQYQAAQALAQEQQLGLWSPEACPAPTPTPSPTPKGTTKPSVQNPESVGGTTIITTPTTQQSSSGVVKKSKNDICHAPGTTYYDRTTNYTSYNSIDECLASGGRLPKK